MEIQYKVGDKAKLSFDNLEHNVSRLRVKLR